MLTRDEYVARAVSLGTVAPRGECKTCDSAFWAAVDAGDDPRWVIMPRHSQPRGRTCASYTPGKAHCTCDSCF